MQEAKISVIRRQNLTSLLQDFVERRVAAGAQPSGLEKSFADILGISQPMLSMMKKGGRSIGTKLARQIEHNSGKEAGWLDQEREQEGLLPAEQLFLSMALTAYRSSSSHDKRELRMLIKSWAEGKRPR